MVLNGLLDDNSLWELLLESFGVESHGSSVQHSFLSVSEPVVAWIKLPLVFSLLLLSRSVVSVSLSIHRVDLFLFILVRTTEREKDLFRTLKALSRQSKLVTGWIDLIRPVVSPGVAFS